MKTIVITSSRSDFGLVRPIIKYFFHRGPRDVTLVNLDQSEILSDEYFQEGIGTFNVVNINSDDRVSTMKNMHATVSLFSKLCVLFSDWLHNLSEPADWVLIPGDRFEIFAATIASFYNNMPIVHIFGGDRSQGGHLDDSVRHSISKLSHIHFPVCNDSCQRLINLGEESWRIKNFGSPVVESVAEALSSGGPSLEHWITPRRYNLICTYHPITTEPTEAGRQFLSIVKALEVVNKKIDISCIFTYPNNEFGSEKIVEILETLDTSPYYRVYKTLGWGKYLRVMSFCDLVIGNSSSAMLEAPIIGVPALNIGTRQQGRYCPPSVEHVKEYDHDKIANKILELVQKTNIKTEHPYGEGNTSKKIYETLLHILTNMSKKKILQKKITY